MEQAALRVGSVVGRVVAGLLLAATPVLGHAQDVPGAHENDTMPRCGPAMDGQVFCKSGTLYECQFVDPNSMERRTGWRWKADILRACGEPEPAEREYRPFVPPPQVLYPPERAEHSRSQARSGNEAPPAQAGGVGQGGTMYVRPRGYVAPDHSGNRDAGETAAPAQ
jgi:hypothetical protein